MKNRLAALSIICLMGLSGLCESKIPGTNLSAMAVPGNARAAAPTDKWDMEKLSRPVKTWPMPQFECPQDGVHAVLIEGDVNGEIDSRHTRFGPLTRFFAYWGLPKDASPSNRVPAMVLVHGGGGTAYPKWVRRWTDRGYAAIAMDNTGFLPVNYGDAGRARIQCAMPLPWDASFCHGKEPLDRQWVWHAVASVIRSHTFIRSLPEVDGSKVGVTGVSWGGFLTCISASVDHRFCFAAPVYGCGFLGNRSHWKDKFLSDEIGLAWLALWDPSHYLPFAECPFLWMDGTNDFAYPLDSLQMSIDCVKPQSFRSTRIRWPHGHGEVSEGPREIQVFADHFTKGSPQLPSFKGFSTSGGRVSAQFDACGRTVKCVHLVYTEDMNPSWPKREFKTGTAHFDEATGGIVAEVPEGAVLYYLNAETEDGLVSSSRWEMKEKKKDE